MGIAVVGVNHNKAPIDVREKVAFSKSQKMKAAHYLLNNEISEVIILSTCNRSEIYIVSDDIENKVGFIQEFYREFFMVEDIKEYLFVKENKEAVYHIHRVAAGLDSMVLGEDEILGQVKEALNFSIELEYSKKILNKLFREAVTTSKKIKNELNISENPISIVYIAIKLLKEKLGILEDKKACIIGIGEIGRLALRHLVDENLEEIFMANRTYKNVEDLMGKFPKIKPVKYENRYEILEEVDILITATASPHTIIDFHHIKDIKKELYIVDLALPRDVDKRVSNLKSIHLYDIDDFKNISEENKRRREEISIVAVEMLLLSVDEFMEWMKSVKVDSLIKALNEKCSKIKEDNLDYIDRKLDLDIREKKIVENALTSALKRVIREPIINLKNTKGEVEIEDYIKVINKLFEF